MISDFRDYTIELYAEFMDTMCGKMLGEGVSRRVYECKPNPDAVIKIERYAPDNEIHQFQNIIEWNTWAWVKGTKHEKWFAPCLYISSNGNILIQAKTKPITRYPDKIPVYLEDTKKQNYGIYKNHVCCHDYGTNTLQTHGMSKRMKKAKWWE